MPVYDPRTDAYIDKAAPFAQPILTHLRDLIHRQSADITETIKWGFPHFEYRDRLLFNMAAFKQHAAFGFWLAALMPDPLGLLQVEERSAMGSLGKLTSLRDLPSDKVLAQYIKDSMRLADEGARVPKAPRKAAAEPEIPGYFKEALARNPKAEAAFRAFSPSHRKEYVQWIVEAKREETRQKRIAQALEWLENGKPRHWKYE